MSCSNTTERYKLKETPYTTFHCLNEAMDWVDANKSVNDEVEFEKVIVITKES